jgi:hypothetical protein
MDTAATVNGSEPNFNNKNVSLPVREDLRTYVFAKKK